jgi:MFS family permease
MGILADTIGRRIVLILCMLSITLHDTWTLIVLYFDNIFPLKAVYFSATFLLIGGGAPSLLPLLLAAVVDATPSSLRYTAPCNYYSG